MPTEPRDSSVTWKTSGKKYENPDDTKTLIDVTEYPRSVSMDEGKEPYGIPIDAPSAVSMMRAFQDKIKKLPAGDEMRKMLEGSFAITFDKNVLLKTISQPKCEGVRFYLCVKKSPAGDDVLSLVTVGVDEAGKDLLYVYKEGTPLPEIPTRSLVAEYGFPPGLLSAPTTSLDPFVLFQFSK